jgi:hypothetical protein
MTEDIAAKEGARRRLRGMLTRLETERARVLAARHRWPDEDFSEIVELIDRIATRLEHHIAQL